MFIYKLLTDKDTSELVTVTGECSLLEMTSILAERRIGALPVIDQAGAMVGIVSERDVIRGLAQHRERLMSLTVGDIMTRSVITCCENDSAEEIYNLMSEKRIRHIPVVRDGAVIAMLSVRDFKTAYQHLQEQSVKDDLTGTANAKAFAEHLDAEFNRFQRYRFPLSLIAIRIEGYRQALEAFDAPQCERFLKDIAAVFTGETRSFDIVGHVSDEVFGVILPNTEEKAAHRACRRIISGVRPFLDDGELATEIRIGVGLAQAGRDTRDGKSLFEQACSDATRAIEQGGDYSAADPREGTHIEAAE